MYDKYFDNLDIAIMKKKIQDFWSLDFGQASYEEIGNAYMSCFNQEKIYEFPIRYYGLYIDKGKKLYRVRKDITQYEQLKLKEDFGYNPKPKPGITGRFNKDLDKVLYVSTDINVPLEEMDIVEGNKFLLIEYSTIKNIPLRMVNVANWYGINNPIHKEKAQILTEFINQIMTLASDENSAVYRITTLLKDYFPFSLADETVGWFYSSTKCKGNNIAMIYPKADGYLKVSDFNIVQMYPNKKLYMQFSRKTETLADRRAKRTSVPYSADSLRHN